MATPPTSYGYPGSINAAALAVWLPAAAASRFSVAGAEDWRVTVQGGLDRGIRINAGTGCGDGIMDVTAEYETMALPLVESGSQWFLVARRRNWAVPATTVPVVIAGTATKALPARSDTAGVESDQPLALCRVQAGQTVVQEIIDLRCWAGNGGLIAADKLALDYLARPGADVLIGSTTWRYSIGANGFWGWDSHQKAMSVVSGTGGYQFSGYVLVEPFAGGRRVTVIAYVTWTGNAIAKGGKRTFSTMGVLLPAEVRGAGVSPMWVSPVSGGGAPQMECFLNLNIADGTLAMRSDAVQTWVTGSQMNVNVTFFIPTP